jgi:tight adherence protein C
MGSMLPLACTTSAVAAALSFALLWRLLASHNAVIDGARSRVPGRTRWSWLARWPISSLALVLAPWVPGRLRTLIGGALERADLDETLDAEQWLMAPVLTGACAMAILGASSHSAGLALAMELALAAAGGAAFPWLVLRDHILGRQRIVLRELPGYLDLLALALEAGCGFGAALQLTVQRSPVSPLRTGMERVLHEVRAGGPRAEALRRLDRRTGVPALGAAVAAIVQAEATGVSLAPVIRAQARRCTQQRFARAEKLAMEAPVKMLGPLVLCIFPCTFIVIGFPIAVRLLWSQ